MREFDVVVMGAGVAGEVAAGRLGQNGLSVAVVEDRLVGGECSYYACMPSKALLRPVELKREVERVAGLSIGPIDVPAVLARRDEVISNLDDSGQLPWLEEHGVTLVRGRGRLDGERRVVVDGGAGDGEELVARKAVVVATGSSALIPDIDGLRDARPWTNIEATTANEVPARLAILGGGVVGVEMAQAWSAFGSKVTLVHRGDRLIEREEPFAGAQVLEALEEGGVDVRLQRQVVARDPSRPGGDRARRRLDVRGGRGARGVRPPSRNRRASASRRSGSSPTAHSSSTTISAFPATTGSTRSATSTAASCSRTWASTRAGWPPTRSSAARSSSARTGRESPRVIFTDPQVGAVGLTLEGAQAAGLDVRHVDVETSGNAGGSFVGHGAAGTSRIVVDTKRRVIVGATITGSEVAEALHAATIAVVAGITIDDLWHAVPSFPTRSELWLKLLEAYGL